MQRPSTLPCRIALAVALMAAGGASAAQKPEEKSAAPALSQLKIPDTAEEHLALAKEYRQRAAQLRFEADLHRQMKTAYSRDSRSANTGAKKWWSKQQAHCDRLISQANGLAVEMDSFAEFYERRGAELQGAQKRD